MKYEQRLAAAAQLAELDDDEENLRTVEEVAKKCRLWGIMAELKPHQSQGVSWLIRRYVRGVNVILGDEMGLGKTLQAICLLAYLKIERKRPGPFLVLCPLSVTDGWASEFAKFSPSLRVLRYVGDKEHRLEMRKEIFEYVSKRTSKSGAEQDLPFDVFLTTYDLAMLDASFLSHIRWHYAIIDEAQRIKNPSSVLYTTLQERYMIPRRLLMTGTPVQNNLSELWALLHFCMPLVFGALEDFVATFKKAAGDNTSGDDKQVKLLRYIVQVFMLRRTKAFLVQNGTLTLPPLSEVTVMAPLVPLQKKIYISLLRKELPKLLTRSVGTLQQQSLQNIVVQLRKACSHPYLFGGVEPEPFEEGEHLVQASGKLLILDALLQKLHLDGHRVLIFAQMTRTLDILQDYLELRRYSYERLDGSVRAEERFAAVQSFSGKPSSVQEASGVENPDDDTNKAFVFLISTRAGGVGLNLVAADTVIFYEQDWNPQVDKQALQRAHRIGQLHHVLAISIVTENTVEEVIMSRGKRKLQLTHNVIGPDDSELGENGTEDPSGNDLRSMIIYGLHKFDPSEDVEWNSNETRSTEMKNMAEKVLGTRLHSSMNMVDERFKIDSQGRTGIDSIYFYDGNDVSSETFIETDSHHDKNADEVAFESWMDRVKDIPLNDQLVNDARGRNRASSHIELEEARAEKRRKIEDRKLAKWEALDYKSLAVEDVSERLSIEQQSSDSGEVQFVFGDCTHPIKCDPNEATIIFSCVDNSGNWGSGGMFDALSNISQKVPDAYGKAHECQDLHLGDLHLIPISGKCSDEHEQGLPNEGSQWVALAVVQTYNPRRKVPRSDISLDHLEICLKKASISAFQNSASIHMPRIGFRSTDKRTEWYTVERLLHKYSAIYDVKIYVYYFKWKLKGNLSNLNHLNQDVALA
ncbi:probable helicase CHR10 isoform X4 [Cryptomeria japonica]|uniref:probable helicase CHR10 isoform X4 n=2 Tax=Cryptomeria japonica TaxID=3369 RepID=UPI0027DA0721|nr:probable helicase CHR10 isoform X4 [Cryptomeria japonica]